MQPLIFRLARLYIYKEPLTHLEVHQRSLPNDCSEFQLLPIRLVPAAI